ncbi:gibberellin-regulated protein 8-like [Cryptomeria japonica]|uniref:gibberellin-regulated protein 8-like n=1 Tax=Cryptomeria japonica TaxID=3369 RepID=UPI0027DA3CA5|nr:gibberellin-regulated protein 8-like [Cryptomeria japonica]
MEMKRAICLCLLLALFLALSFQTAATEAVDSGPAMPSAPKLTEKGKTSTSVSFCSKPAKCQDKCNFRCEYARLKRCMKFCKDCCKMCSCVPSGHYGNKDECPCYRDRKNSKGTSKCP